MVVDIIIPYYNAEETIDKALASVAAQIYKPSISVKVLIVDDKSDKPLTLSALQHWLKLIDIRIIRREENGGAGQARQTGIDKSKADFLMFLDADDEIVTPHAIERLVEAMDDRDFIMGQFIEETEKGVVSHGENYTWMHGKMYRRSFLVDNDIRFNDSRYNEDVAFNTLCQALSGNIGMIPQVVYSWENNKSSTVRSDAVAYRCGFGWRAFVENTTWSILEQKKRGVDPEWTKIVVLESLARFYFQFFDAATALPQEVSMNLDVLEDYFKKCVLPYLEDGTIDSRDILAAYLKMVAIDGGLCVPLMSYGEWLEMLGYPDPIEVKIND